MNNKISCSHLLSSLTLHCSYRLRFFAFRDHRCGRVTLFHNCSLLGFVPLEALDGLSTQTGAEAAPKKWRVLINIHKP